MSKTLWKLHRLLAKDSVDLVLQSDFFLINYKGDTLIKVVADPDRENVLELRLIAVRKSARGHNLSFKAMERLFEWADFHRIAFFGIADLIGGVADKFFDPQYYRDVAAGILPVEQIGYRLDDAEKNQVWLDVLITKTDWEPDEENRIFRLPKQRTRPDRPAVNKARRSFLAGV